MHIIAYIITFYTNVIYILFLLFSRSVMSDSLRPHGLQPASLLCPWDSPGKTTGMCCHFLLQGLFPTQGSNLDILSVSCIAGRFFYH